MHRWILSLAVGLMLASASANAATCTVSTSGTWTAIGTGTAVFDCGTPTTADTVVIPATYSLTIPAGSIVDFASAAGTITNNGTLVVNGSLKLYNDATGTGTWNVVGTLKSCATSTVGCTIAGQSAANVYAMDTLLGGQRVSGGWRLTYTTNAWDGGFAVDDIIEYADIDGNPANDSPAGGLRPFFHIVTANPASDYFETTYGVGSSVSDYTLAYNEGNSSVSCYVGQTDNTVAAGVTAIDIADSEPDGSDLDQTWSSASGPLDRSTTISLPTGTLTNNQDYDFVGQWICLGAAGTDASCHLIWSSKDGGANRDLVRVWPPLKAMDYTASAKTCTIGWGEPNKTTAGKRGLPLGEFLIFTPAQVVGNRPGVSIDTSTTGQVNASFALFGPHAGVTGYGVKIAYKTDAVIASTETHTWHTGLSGNSAIGIADDSHIEMGSSSSGVLTLDHVRFTHDFVPRYAASSSDSDPDRTSGNHGIANVGTGMVAATNFGCFKIGDVCAAITGSAPSVNRFRNITCGWLDGQSTSCVKASVAAHTVTIDGLYTANTSSKMRMCDGATGGTPTTPGTRCAVDADCTGTADVCVSAVGAHVTFAAGSVGTVRGLVALGSDSDVAYVVDIDTTGTTGSPKVSVDGGLILDDRVDNPNVSGLLTMFAGVNSVKHVSMPFAVHLGSHIVSTYSNNYAQHVRASGGTAYGVLSLLGDLGADGAPTFRLENNVILDIYDAAEGPFLRPYDTTIPSGAKLYVNNNRVDRSRIGGSTTYGIDLNDNGTDFGVAASGELIQMKNNAVSGYAGLLRCPNPNFPASSANLEITGNALAPPSNVAIGDNGLVSFGCTQGSSYSDPINRVNQIANRYQMMGGPIAGYTGPKGVAGYRQTAFLTSLGIASVWIEGRGNAISRFLFSGGP